MKNSSLPTSAAFFAGLCLLLLAPAISAAKPGAPVHLLCEYQNDPLGLDVPSPRLSWWLRDDRRGARQTAYQILVASSPDRLARHEGDLWDTGKVASDQSHLVAYAGQPLASRQRCWWKVRTWDAAGTLASAWSRPAQWEMALLQSSDWKAHWITPVDMKLTAQPIPLGSWVWHPTAPADARTVCFRADVVLPEDPLPHFSGIAISADDQYELFVNGKKVADNGNWKDVEQHFGNQANLKAGTNVLAVKVTNTQGVGGLIVGVLQSYYGGQRQYFTNLNWICSEREVDQWNQPDFKADGWKPAKGLGPAGIEPWSALEQPFDGPRRSQMVRNEFTLPSKVTRARAYVSGLGFYELHLNGQRVGEDVFTPGWTQYEKRIQYQVYDVTRLLQAGPNAVGAILGNGWWSSGLGWGGGHERHAKPGENLRFLLQLEITCLDGSTHTMVTDPAWRACESPIVEDTLYHGETHDARLEQPGWDEAGFAAPAWTGVKAVPDPLTKLCAQREPSLRITEELKPVAITEPQPGVYILDFGQNHSGRPRLSVKAPAGTAIEMVHAEYLKADGTLERANYRSARATDTYICQGQGTERWEPRFTYRGFRYLQVTGLPSKPNRNTIVSRVLHSAPAMTGTFECSNPLLNRIGNMVRWGQRSNMHSVPTDCPQRDERLGWMGDAQVFAPISIWNMDMALFYTKWMRDIVDAQQPNGSVPGVCPTVGGWVIGPGRSAWADAITILPWHVYVYCGDPQILTDSYEGNRKWIEFIQSKLNADGLYEEPTWGDWVPVETTPDRPIAAMYGFYATDLMRRTAELLGRAEDAATWKQQAEAQRVAFNRKHFHPATSAYVNDSQTANLLPLAFGIAEPDHRQVVADRVAADAEKRGGHHTTGFLGTPYVLPVLAEHGHADLAYRILSREEFPSLGYMLSQGATTVWERWNSDKEGPGMNSRNHFAFGSMAQWLFEGLAGLNPDPDQPGFKHVIIRPHVVGDLDHVEAQYPGPYGELEVDWERDGSEFELELTLPPNSYGTLHLPAADAATVRESGRPVSQVKGIRFIKQENGRAQYELQSGTYRFKSTLQ